MPGSRVQKTLLLRGTTPVEAYDQWMETIWRSGGGLGTPTILETGDTSSGLGCRRQVGGGVIELIESAQKPDTLSYGIKGGPFPVSTHRGTVCFTWYRGGYGSTCVDTLIEWECEYTPSMIGSVLCCCGVGLSCIISTSFSTMLGTLESKNKEKQLNASKLQ
jgi:hypothetical protein